MNNSLIYLSEGEHGYNVNLSNLREEQRKFVLSNKLYSGITGGYQSGKSTSGVVKHIVRMLQNPNVPQAYYLPTYGLFEDMLIPKIEQMYGDLNIDWTHDKGHNKIKSKYGELWMRSMDTPDRIVSYSVGYSIVDEIDVVHPNKREQATKRISSRNSYKKPTANSIDYMCTPEGYEYMYKFFVRNHNENKTLFKLSTLDNEDNLGGGYIQGLREQYTPDQLKAYLNGEFVNITSGNVYSSFDRELHVMDMSIRDGEALHVGMDFNIGAMNAVIHVKRTADDYEWGSTTPPKGAIMHAVDEITDYYDTRSVCEELISRYPNRRILVYPDASGSARSTSGKGDHDILKDYRFKIKSLKSNPRIKDRVSVKNNLYHKMRYFISPKCDVYIDAQEKQGYKNSVPDKSSGFDHVNEAGDYCAYFIDSRKPVVVSSTKMLNTR